VRRAILTALILAASPAMAEQQAYSWGGSYAHIKAGDGGAVVTLHNGPTVWPTFWVLFGLGHDGIAVSIEVEQGPGDVPDRVSVIPPAGFVAIPHKVTMPEDTEAVIQIVPIDLVPMG